jgi:hypothetical protein
MSDLFERFKIVQGFKSDSASRSDIWESMDTQTGKSVIFKVFMYEFQSSEKTTSEEYTEIPHNREGFLHEINVYQTLREYLIDDPSVNCRNILCIVGDGTFTHNDLYAALKRDTTLSAQNIEYNLNQNLRFLIHLKEKPRYSITRELKKAPKLKASQWAIQLKDGRTVRLDLPVLLGCFITPKIDQLSIEDAIEKKVIRIPECFRYLFVIFITLLLMSSVGVNQNDLHWGNILLSKTYVGPSPRHKKHYFMVYNDQIILIDNPMIPIIYDFDRTSINHKRISTLEYNKDFYATGGNCPRFHAKRDFVKSLCCMFQYCNRLRATHPPAEEEAVLRQIQTEILGGLIKSEQVREAILRSNEACWMSTVNQDNSILCFDRDLLHGVVSRQAIIDWCFSKCNYLSCTLNEFAQAAKRQTAAPSYAKVKQMCTIFQNDLVVAARESTEDQLRELRATVQSNIQIVNYGKRRYDVTKERQQLLETLTTQTLSLLR